MRATAWKWTLRSWKTACWCQRSLKWTHCPEHKRRDASKALPRIQVGIHEQKCQELGQTIKYMSGRQEKLLNMLELVERSAGRPSKTDFSRNQGAGRKNLPRRNGTFGPWKKFGRTGETPKWRKGGKSLSPNVVSLGWRGSRASDMEAELPSDDMDGR